MGAGGGGRPGGVVLGGRCWGGWAEQLTTGFVPRISVPVHSFSSFNIRTTGESPRPGLQPVCPPALSALTPLLPWLCSGMRSPSELWHPGLLWSFLFSPAPPLAVGVRA